MKSRKVLIGLLTTLLASSCSLVIKPVRPSTPSSQPTSSSVKPSTSSSASSSTSSSASSSSSSSSSKEDSSSISSPSSSSSSNSSATTNEQNVAQINAVKEAINAIGSVTLESLDLIANAESLLNALAPELKAEVGSELLEKLVKARNDYDALVAEKEAEEKAIKAVEDAINAIGTVTLESSKAIADAEGLFEALSDELEAKVSAELKTVLENARKTYDELVAKDEAEAKAIKAVEDAIKDIGTVTLESLSKIENAESLLNELDDSLEAKVSSELKEDLLAAREEYNRLVKEKEEAENTAKVNAVKDAINAIGNVTLDSKDEIDAAYDLYNALPDNLKELVDASFLKLLEDAKKDYEDLVAGSTETSFKFELGANGEPSKEPNASKTTYEEELNGYTLSLTNGERMFPGSTDGKGNSCIKLGNSSTGGSFTLVVPEGINKVIIYVSGRNEKNVNIIINDESPILITTHSIDGEYTPVEIDTSINKTITVKSAKPSGGDARCLINSIEFSKATMVDPDLELIESVETLINNLGTITLDSKEALDAAIKAFDDLTDAQEAKVNAEVKAKLEEAKETYDDLVAEKEAEEKAIKAVEDAINAIGDVTLNSLSAIENAEKLLAELDDELEAKVDATLKEALVKARKDYEDLVADASADAIAIARVEVFINRIGTVTLDSKEVLEAAEEAYAALDEDLKEQVDSTLRQNLLDARAAYDALVEQDKIDTKAAEDFTALVEAIGTVEEDDLERIEAAEAALKQLTDAQLAKVDEEVLEKLENARKEYDSLTSIDISKVLTAEEAMEYMKSDAYVEFTVLHVTGVISKVKPTSHGYDITLENGFQIYSGKLEEGLNIPQVGYTVTASGKAKIYTYDDGTKVYEIAWDESHEENPSIYDVDRNSTPEQDAAMIKDVVDAIELIGKITLENYKEKLEAIKTAEQLLKDLPIDLKDDIDAKLVEDLEEARKAHDEFAAANAPDSVTFELGTNKDTTTHGEGSEKKEYSETIDGLKLNISGGSKFYTGANDTSGNSCFKLGTGSVVGSFTITVPQNVTNVIFYVSGYKASTAKFTINGEEKTVSTTSNSGQYTPVEVDTTTVKTIIFSTTSDSLRCMINSIKFELTKEEVDADQAAVNNVEYNISIIGDLTLENFESKKAVIDAAEAAYNALTPEQQAKVNPDSVKALNDAKAKYEELVLEKEALDAAAVKAVKDAINALENVTLEDLEAIEEVEYAYQNLSEDLQKQIDEELVNRLKAIREEYEALYETSLPLEEGLLASFEFGANSSVGHVDIKTPINDGETYTDGDHSLTLVNVSKVYDGNTKDEKGKSALKLGTSDDGGTLTFEVPEDVTSVVILVANYKTNKAIITINGENHELENSSNEGKYDVITIDTTTTKSITLATGASNEKRCMINTIKFFGEESQTPVDPNPDQPEPEDPTPEPDQPEVSDDGNLTIPSTALDYYKDVRGMYGEDLSNALTELLSETHETSTSYDDIRGMFQYADVAPSGKLLTFYAHAEFTGVWDEGNTYNREHIWPQKLGWFKTSGAGSDLHHIRPTLPNINSTRNDNPYGEVNESTAKAVEDRGFLGGYYENEVFEPLDHSKGDVARILFYLITRYEKEATEAEKSLLDVAESIEMLLRWNELDPVDDTEMNRNNYVSTIQGNRNPFIDHPEFVNMIYDENYSGEGALIDTKGSNSLMSDAKRVELVTNAINSIGEVSLEKENLILTAENLYAKLPDELKSKITDELKTKLTNARTTYDILKNENDEKPDVPASTDSLAIFSLGEKVDSTVHKDGSTAVASYSEEVNGYTLKITNAEKVYPNSNDAKGNSCIKLGTGDYAASFTFTVGSNVNKVIIYVAGYKNNQTKISINEGDLQTISTLSNNGEYTPIEIDTTTNKNIKFSTGGAKANYRCMINAIEFIGDKNYLEPEDPDQGGDVVEPDNPEDNEDPKEPETPMGEIIAGETIANYSSNNGWENGVYYESLQLDTNIVITAKKGTNNGKYYTSGNQWRFYQSEQGTLTITALNEKAIKSIKITYASQNTGVLTYENKVVESNSILEVNASSITLAVGNTDTTVNNGQVRVTAIEVIYE